MILESRKILYEDKDIIVCHKPAGIATQTAKLGQQDMESLVKNYLKAPYIGVVHRLDQPVEGILVFAKTREAAGKLSKQDMEKKYCALVLVKADNRGEVCGETAGTLVDYLLKNGKENTSRVVEKDDNAEAKRSELTYHMGKPAAESLDGDRIPVLADISLQTGRHHQIRVQMAYAGMPLLGDLKYGTEESKHISREKAIKDIALCAYSLTFKHPGTKKKMNFTVAPENKVFKEYLPFNPLVKKQ